MRWLGHSMMEMRWLSGYLMRRHKLSESRHCVCPPWWTRSNHQHVIVVIALLIHICMRYILTCITKTVSILWWFNSPPSNYIVTVELPNWWASQWSFNLQQNLTIIFLLFCNVILFLCAKPLYFSSVIDFYSFWSSYSCTNYFCVGFQSGWFNLVRFCSNISSWWCEVFSK